MAAVAILENYEPESPTSTTTASTTTTTTTTPQTHTQTHAQTQTQMLHSVAGKEAELSTTQVKGLARLIQIRPLPSSNPLPSIAVFAQPPSASVEAAGSCIIDLSLSHLPPGQYVASIRVSGDISRGSRSVGGIWRSLKLDLTVGEDGRGSGVCVCEGLDISLAVGRGLVVERLAGGFQDENKVGGDVVIVGVIARSAGVWENEKMVCSCSGKTVWEERGEQVGRGMV